MNIHERVLEISKIQKKKIQKLLRENKGHKNIYTYMMIAITFIMVVSLFSWRVNAGLRAYEVQLEGKVLATIRSEEDFTEAIELIKNEIKNLYGHEFMVPEDIEFIQTKAKKDEITDLRTIANNIKRQLDMQVKAVAILVEGEAVAIVENHNIAEAIFEEIKQLYIEEDIEYEYIGFSENVEIKEIAAEMAEINSKKEALRLITKGTDEEKVHAVAAGESSWVIARKYDLSVEDIEKANPTINPDRLQIGQEISLIVPRPYISVKTKQYVELVQEIDFETEYEETEALYKGDRKITVQGAKGKREIKGYLVKENGNVVDTQVVEEKILSEPTTRVIAEGTTPRPATVATGTFIRPTRGRLTSGFGMRWGRRHEGIDIAASTGTSITAADAGRVSFAGVRGAYGNLVIIDHENGYQTYYAHASKLLVKRGDRVYKGEEIAKVGSTGRSTGPHLHFEVRKNGTPVNPLQFVNY
ncbi:MAG: peptidoglycan DD-metalloendopeptidase family protein [Clostridiaceae bacterium]|nr:peptidoglycan DD-metalloendopeptidase family protein [Clostridiaceae bacterium]